MKTVMTMLEIQAEVQEILKKDICYEVINKKIMPLVEGCFEPECMPENMFITVYGVGVDYETDVTSDNEMFNCLVQMTSTSDIFLNDFEDINEVWGVFIDFEKSLVRLVKPEISIKLKGIEGLF